MDDAGTLPGGGTSPAATFTVQAPTPIITSVSPTSFVSNSGSAPLVINGTNLKSSSKVLWNGTAIPTVYYGSYNYTTGTYTYALDATVSASLLASTGTATVTVNTPTAAANSNAVTVTITDPPVPTVTGLSPGAVPTNTQVSLTVAGTGFSNASTVNYNGTALATTFVNTGKLTATVPAAGVASLGWSAVSVSTPTPGGGTSGSLPLTVYNVIAVGLNHILYEPYSRNL